MMYNEIMKNKVIVILNLVTFFVCLLFFGCASNGSLKGKSPEELETKPSLFADWKYKGFGQEYPLWAEAVINQDFETVADLLGLHLLSEDDIVYRADIYYGENLDVVLKDENPADESVIKDTWCYIDPYYVQYEDRYVYITLRQAQEPLGSQGMEE